MERAPKQGHSTLAQCTKASCPRTKLPAEAIAPEGLALVSKALVIAGDADEVRAPRDDVGHDGTARADCSATVVVICHLELREWRRGMENGVGGRESRDHTESGARCVLQGRHPHTANN